MENADIEKTPAFFKRTLNRKMRRKFKNRAQTEGRSKKFYTTKRRKNRGKLF